MDEPVRLKRCGDGFLARRNRRWESHYLIETIVVRVERNERRADLFGNRGSLSACAAHDVGCQFLVAHLPRPTADEQRELRGKVVTPVLYGRSADEQHARASAHVGEER